MLESLRVEHDFGDEFLVRLGHCYASKKLFEIVGQIGSSSISRVHSDEYSSVGTYSELTAGKIDLGVAGL